jgi:hypothetical protein
MKKCHKCCMNLSSINFWHKCPPPPDLREALHADIMLAIADEYSKTPILWGAARSMRRKYSPIRERFLKLRNQSGRDKKERGK